MAFSQAELAESDVHEVVDPRDAAESAGLAYVSDDEPGITRRKAGKGWFFRWPDGRKVTDPATVARIRKLAIPPAYTDVWICPNPDGHIQATGRDAKGRKQYRYHAAFREVRDSVKYEHVTAFAAALPQIRATIKKDMALHGPAPPQGAGHHRVPAGDDPDPRRQRRLRQAEPFLRAHHPAQPACPM